MDASNYYVSNYKYILFSFVINYINKSWINKTEPGRVAHTCNPSTPEAEA
jgi:hypothetical protein